MSLTPEFTTNGQATGGELARITTLTLRSLDDGIIVLLENFTGMKDWDSLVNYFESISKYVWLE